MVDANYLDALRLEVRTNHPSVAAAQARIHAAEAGIRGVRLWEDPTAGIGVMAAERSMRADDGDIRFMGEVMLPRRKLYDARRIHAAAERSVMDAERRSVIVTLELQVGETAIELGLANELLRIETNQLAWLERMATNAVEKLKDPAGTASEPLRIESELAQERQRIDSTQREQARLMRQLNILLGRETDARWPNLRLPESADLSPALTQELNRLFEVNPMLQAGVNTASLARSEIEVARRERNPIFSVGVESSIYSGGDFRQATVLGKMTLPFFNRSVYRASVERAEQQQIAAEREVEALHRRLRGEVVAAQSEAENAARQAATFARDVIPRTEKAAESTQNAWITAKANLLEVLEARRSVLNAKMEERRFVAAHDVALEKLRSIVPPQINP